MLTSSEFEGQLRQAAEFTSRYFQSRGFLPESVKIPLAVRSDSEIQTRS